VLAQRYLVLYGVSFSERLAVSPSGESHGAVDVEAALFDLESGERLCELAFSERLDLDSHDLRWAEALLRSQTRDRFLTELGDVSGGAFKP
jgi:hypothetical protein